MTTIYLIKHSEPDKKSVLSRDLSLQDINEMQRLTSNGKVIALLRSESLGHIDYVYSSTYERARETANIISKDHNVPFIIYNEFDEKVNCVDQSENFPSNYEEIQFYDEKYKIGKGESQAEVVARMKSGIDDILKRRENSIIAIVSHATAISYYLKSFCSNLNYGGSFTYNGKEFFDGNFSYCETFKLSYDKDKLIGIECLPKIVKEKEKCKEKVIYK